MFIVTLKKVGPIFADGTCFALGEYETFDEACNVVKDEVKFELSYSGFYEVSKNVDRSDSGDRVTIHKHTHADNKCDFDVDYIYEIFQKDSSSS